MLILLNLLQPINPPVVPNYEDPNVLQKYIAPEAINPVVQAPAAQVQAPAAQVQASVQTAPTFDPNAVLGGLMAQAPKAPVYSMTDEATLRKMAKGQKVGDLLSLLSDTFGVTQGAPVAARQYTSTAPYLQKILENRQKYQQDLQDYQNKDFARKIQMATNAAEQAKADAAAKQRAYQFEKTQGFNESKYRAEQDAKHDQGLLNENKAVLEGKKFEETKRANAVREKQNAARIAKMGEGKGDKTTTPIKIKTDKKTYTVQPEEASLYRRKAQDDPRLRAQHPDWFIQVGGVDQWDTTSKSMVKKGGTYKLSDDVKDEDVARQYLQWEESPEAPSVQQSSGPGAAIPATPLLDPGYGAVGGHKKTNASTGGLY